jgi:hypothetical protein
MLVAREESHEAGERFSWARGARRRALEDAIEKERSQWDMDKPQTSAQRHAGAAERGEAKGEEEEEQGAGLEGVGAEVGEDNGVEVEEVEEEEDVS